MARVKLSAVLMMTAGLGLYATLPAALADSPVPNSTATLEIRFLQFTIDHHFGALRMTELAAGTETSPPGASINADDGTPPTPNTRPTVRKADVPDIISLARRNNRMQREEILEAQEYLYKWYGINYQPHLSAENAGMIAYLESLPAGTAFDEGFLKTFSAHHTMILAPASLCIAAHFVEHAALQRYCNNIWHSQISDIEQMRAMLCFSYNQCAFVPFKPEDPITQ